MPTLQEIQADIRKLRAIEENKREIEKLGEERRRAEKALKRLQSPRLTSFKRKFVKANIRLGTKLIKGGKASGKFLAQGVRNLEEAERREELAKRRRPASKKRKSTKKTTSKKRTSKKSSRKKR